MTQNIDLYFIIQIKTRMKEVYLLIPLLTSPNSSIQPDIEKVLDISSQQYELYQFDENKYAIQLHSQSLGYHQLTEILQQRDMMNKKLSMLENTLKNYEWSFKQTSIQASNIDSLMKKAMKYKQIKDENKKLKKLLQNQLQNTEKVREQTQKTMRVLRDEFDTLVKQMNKQVQSRQSQRVGQSSRGSQKHSKNQHKNVVF